MYPTVNNNMLVKLP